MSGDLKGVWLKIKRADDHRATLEHQAKAWVESQRYEVIHDHDTQSGDHLIRLRMKSPPDLWGIVLGEFAHNLRSALDHLVYQLVINNNITPPDRNRLQFPIFSQQKWFRKHLPDGRGGYLVGVADTVRDQIRDLQPCHRRNLHPTVGSDPLEILASINDVDKHRVLHPVAAVAAGIQAETRTNVTPVDPISSVQLILHNYIGLPIEEAVVFGIRVVPPEARVEINLNQAISIGVAFGEGQAISPGGLIRLIDEVTSVVKIFEPLF